MFAKSALFTTVVLTALACSDDKSGTNDATGGTAGESGSSGTAGSGGAVGGASGSSQGGNGGQSEQAGNAGNGGDSGTEDGTDAGIGGAGGESGGGGEGGTGGSGLTKQFNCPAGPFPAPVVGAQQQVCQGFHYNQEFNEGTTWVPGQNAFFFSNFIQGAVGGNTSGDIIKYTPGGDCEIFITGSGTNGLAVAADGNIIGGSQKTRSVTEYDVQTKEASILSDSYMGMMLDSPNDLVERSDGNIYFTNPTYELGGRPLGVGPAVFWRDPAGVLTELATGGAPNGIALSPDESKLYVVLDVGQNGAVWDLDANGVPSNKQSFPLNADGMAVDCAGNIYLSGGTILDSQGNPIGTFPGGTNLAFGGADGKTLLVASNNPTALHTIQMNIPGLP